MSRVPLRLRLTVVFAVAMAAVLAATGAFVYLRLGDSLLEQIDERLLVRAGELRLALVAGEEPLRLAGGDDEFAQVLAADGAVVEATPGFDAPLLPRAELPSSRHVFAEADLTAPGDDEREHARLLAVPDGERVVVVGAFLDDREEALEGLLAELLVGGPLALLVASAAGYLLAGAALRPVGAMRRQAAEISADTAGERLPLPAAQDEIRRLGETLNAMLDRLAAGLRRERRFVADASHELRTPLALLRTELELALRRPRTAGELEAALRSAAEDVDRLTRLAEDLLVLASSEEDGVPLRRTRLAVPDLVADVARRFAARAEDAGRAIRVGTVSVAEVDGDRLRLEQALGNLVDNALRHGGGTVTLGAGREDGRVVLWVRDEGPGFPADFLERAFERFSRADAARAGAGPGLGLAIVDAIARAHGGEARAASRPEGGAEVAVAVTSRPAVSGSLPAARS